MFPDRLFKTKESLEHNGFEVFLCENTNEARNIFIKSIMPIINPTSASYGDSETLKATKIIEEIKKNDSISFIETFDMNQSREERIKNRKDALRVDLFLTGSNAITENGQIINLDMTGNRISGIVFGPTYVVLAIGKNKIVKNIDEGMKRVGEVCAPGNIKRHPKFNAPCQKTGYCVNCNSEQRICNVWSIIEKCNPKKRIKILLINDDLGL